MEPQPIHLSTFLQRIQQEKDLVRLSQHYGLEAEHLHERVHRLAEVIACFQKRFPGEETAWVLRVPGRINLMGVHIDHRGGWCNFMPYCRETVFCFSPRCDDRICATNLSPLYPDFEFSIEASLPPAQRGRWLAFIESIQLEQGHWQNYIQGAALKLFDAANLLPFRGMNVSVGGDIPPQSGLSSSSTLVSGTVLALCAINRVGLNRVQLVELCGEAEWYVGTRGGCGDHAAMILGQRGCITHVGFKPLTYTHYPLPPRVEVILCHSGLEANKATNAKEKFNSCIAAYEIALILYRHHNPDLADRILWIRDIQPGPEFLKLDLPEFYQRLKRIPIEITVNALYEQYATYRSRFNHIFKTYGHPKEALPVREVLLFGAAECSRSRHFMDCLKQSNFKEAGRLMYVSHDGDRIITWKNGQSTAYRSPHSDFYLDDLSRRSQMRPDDESCFLASQPGGYRCSVSELDRLVDRC